MFKEYMEQYKECLTEAKSLQDLLAEAKENHRVQKLLVAYMTKDRETYTQMLSLAATDSFAQKLVNHCLVTLYDLMSGRVDDRQEMKDLMVEVNKVTNFLSQPKPEVKMQHWEQKGYVNMFVSYLFENVLTSEMTPEMKRLEEECLRALNETSAAAVA